MLIIPESVFGCSEKEELTPFSVNEYSYFTEAFPSTLVLGEIQNSEDAKSYAEQVWVSTYGDQVLFQKPYQVLWDDVDRVFLVKGTLHFYESGGVAHILIHADTGRVLAVWHEK